MNLNSSPTNPVLFPIPIDKQKQTMYRCGASPNDNCIFTRCLSSHFGRQRFFVACNIERQQKKMNVPTIDIVQTGANIKALRKAAGIKVKDVANTLGVSTQAVAKWQAGTALPTIDNLVILAAMLDTKIDDILVIA